MKRASNRELLIPYFAPYAAYVAADLVLERFGSGAVYAARLLLVPAVLLWAWPRYQRIRGPRSPGASVAWGALVGLLGCGLWLALLAPFGTPGGEPWSDLDWALRLAGSALLPPVFEELLFRGLALGLILQWQRTRRAGVADAWEVTLDRESVQDLAPGDWTVAAVLASSVLFAIGHSSAQLPAAVAYGLLMCGLWIARGDLLSCMFAHAVTNVALALYVRASGNWDLW